mmetsp:Transcript_7316/g.26584  ORF Transcript_7316/g.26584 Transcript_7316/m.26584 type:complete len:202 (-) Transcript_7316:2852-3457(-)
MHSAQFAQSEQPAEPTPACFEPRLFARHLCASPRQQPSGDLTTPSSAARRAGSRIEATVFAQGRQRRGAAADGGLASHLRHELKGGALQHLRLPLDAQAHVSKPLSSLRAVSVEEWRLMLGWRPAFARSCREERCNTFTWSSKRIRRSSDTFLCSSKRCRCTSSMRASMAPVTPRSLRILRQELAPTARANFMSLALSRGS